MFEFPTNWPSYRRLLSDHIFFQNYANFWKRVSFWSVRFWSPTVPSQTKFVWSRYVLPLLAMAHRLHNIRNIHMNYCHRNNLRYNHTDLYSHTLDIFWTQWMILDLYHFDNWIHLYEKERFRHRGCLNGVSGTKELRWRSWAYEKMSSATERSHASVLKSFSLPGREGSIHCRFRCTTLSSPQS